MTKIEIIKVGNRNSTYIGGFTSKEIEIIQENINYYPNFSVINLFSGKSNLGNYRVDYTFGNIKKDVFEYLKQLKDIKHSIHRTLILDAPYNKKYADKYQKIGNTPQQFIIFANAKKTTELFNLIERKLKPVEIILKSWNYYVPKGYTLFRGYLCYSGGYRKPTILLILKRNKNEVKIKNDINRN